MAVGPGGGEIFPDQYILTAEWQASPSHLFTLRLIAETPEYLGNYTLYISGEPVLRWKRNEESPFGIVVSELEFACFLDPNAGPGSGIEDWPNMFQDETYGRWRVELDVNGVLFWFGYLLPQTIRTNEADPLSVVTVIAADGLASMKESLAPVTDEYTFERVNLFMRKAFETNPDSAYPWEDVIVVTTDNAWRFRKGSTDYYWYDCFLYPFAFIDSKTGKMDSWWDVITELCTRFMLIVTVSAGRIKIADVLTQSPSVSGIKRTDADIELGQLLTQTTISFPVPIPSAKVESNPDSLLADWENEVDYLREWIAPWTLDDQGSIVPSNYVQVISRQSGLAQQTNIADGVLEQKAQLRQTSLNLDMEPHSQIEVDVKIICSYITYTYNPSTPGDPTLTFSDGSYQIELKCGELWYNPSLEQWQESQYIIASSGTGDNRILFVITKLPPVPDKLTLILRNPLGDPSDTEVSVSYPVKTHCAAQVVQWAKVTKQNNLALFNNFFYPSNPAWADKSKSRTSSVFVESKKEVEFKVTKLPIKTIGLPYYWPDVNQLRLESAISPDIDSVWRTDNSSFVSADMDEVWLESFMKRYGASKPVQYFETEFWPAIFTPVEAVTLADGSVLRNPVELECNLFKATVRGRWERDVP